MQAIMKKTTVFAAIVIAAVACTPKELDPASPVKTMTLRASVAVQEDSKTVLIDNGDKTYDVNWAAGDAINVNGEASTGIDIDGTDARIATFTLPVVEAPYVAVYPSSVYTSDFTVADGETPASMKITLPAVQSYVAGGFDPAAAVLLGKGNSSLTFNHGMAYLKITVSGGEDTHAIKSVRVQANDGKPVSGLFTATFGDTPSIGSGTGTFSTVTLDCGAGVAQGTAMYIAIPAATYPHGINLLIVDASSHYMTKKSTASFDALAGKVYPTSLAFNPEGTYIQGGIYSAADWNSFVNAANAGDYSAWQDGDGVVNLMADATFVSEPQIITASFSGTLDGHDHTVSGQEQGLPLFAEIAAAGTVKNLKRGGKYTYVANTGEAGTAAIAKFNYGTIKNCENNCTMDELTFSGNSIIAGIAGQNGGTIEDCVNNMNITYRFNITTDGTGVKCYGGGISANADKNSNPGKFIRCTNNGNITITKTNAAAVTMNTLAIGGIVGQVKLGTSSSYSLFDGCTNSGAIKYYEDRHNGTNGAYCIGGIVGQVGGRNSGGVYVISSSTGYYAKIKDCSNSGIIDISSCNSSSLASVQTGARQIYNGGISGLVMGLSGSPVDIINCSNTGIILGGGGQRTGASDSYSYANNFSSGLLGAAGLVAIDGGSSINTFGLSGNTLTTVDKYACASGVIGWAFDNCTIKDFSADMTISTSPVTPLYTGYIGGIASGKTVTVSGSCSVKGASAKSSYGATGSLSGTVTEL